MSIDRRHLLKTGALALSGALGAAEFSLATAAEAGPATRERLLLDFDWRFRLGHGSDPAQDLGFGFGQSDFSKTGDFGFAKPGFGTADWRTLDLPHDWAVELPFVRDEAGEGDADGRSHGFKPLGRRFPATSVGWYRREFELPASDAGRRFWLEFDGVMRDTLVFVNGCFIGRHDHGYTPFRFDITDFANVGGSNVVMLRVDASAGDGWFYEGAGIYRHVWLYKSDALHLGRWDSTVRATVQADGAALALAALVHNDGSGAERVRVRWQLQDADGRTVATAESREQLVPPEGRVAFDATARLRQPRLWSLDDPHRYTAVVTLEAGGKPRDREAVAFGVRSAVFDPDKGFFLNGKPVKIQGVCNHQDHAGVGAAVPDALQAWRIGVMQGMGCNALRTSHNMPAPELVEACDRLGVMVMAEARQLSSSEEGLAQLEVLVKRLRNSPSVILWSIGNEEWQLQKPMASQGRRLAASMVRRCHRLDPTRLVTAAVNGDNEDGVSDAVDVIGFNYVQQFPDGFHKKYPKRPIIGSETSSAIATRGEYETVASRNVIGSYDGKVPWGTTPEEWWKFHAEREWLAGGFAWTGFDYRGEPTPYGWPSISSQFGIVDICGFPKDYYHYYRAWWQAKPALHVFPHWNWAGREGKPVDVWVYSNADEVELLLNGKSLGRQAMPKLGHLSWKVNYEPGAIEARAYRGGQLLLTEKRETTGGAASVRLVADRTTLAADGEDVTVIRAECLDDKGRWVPTAQDKLVFRVRGAGRLIGVGNGDPNSHESDQGSSRSLFNGLAQLIVRAGRQPGDIVITAAVESQVAGIRPARLVIQAERAQPRPAVA
ncbi:MAG: DUF4982 domain-containing protein [Burkholderiales bacterium]|jgi:beta-galactosidase|nr:DUF4982 domain-containing protein [Burkholderiales bacterium]